MSLNWQFTDKERFEKLSDEEKTMNDAYIWGCMFTDIGEITEKNAMEFLVRYTVKNRLFGPLFYLGSGDSRKEYTPALEDVRKRIGLRCNISDRSRSYFLAKVFRHLADELKLENKYKEEKQKVDAAIV